MSATLDPPGERGLDGLCVLVVDDVDANAISLAQALEAVGARAWMAATAGDAVQLASRERFDVFICDLMMPDMDGYRMLALLRGTPLNGVTPAIAHTGHGADDVEDAAAAAGYDRVMSKPAGLKSFVTAIRALCGLMPAALPDA